MTSSVAGPTANYQLAAQHMEYRGIRAHLLTRRINFPEIGRRRKFRDLTGVVSVLRVVSDDDPTRSLHFQFTLRIRLWRGNTSSGGRFRIWSGGGQRGKENNQSR